MKHLKFAFLFFTVIFSFAFFYSFGQDSSITVPTSGGALSFLSHVPLWVWGVIYGAYELLVRVIPTAKNWSLLSLIIKIVQAIAPNNSITLNGGSGTHE